MNKKRSVFIRTVTHYYVGSIVEENATEFVLTQASWIADTGRFGEAMKTGKFSEAEPYPDNMRVHVYKGAIVDLCEWPH